MVLLWALLSYLSWLINLFLGHHENIWLKNYKGPVLFYQRYIDNTFCIFHAENEAKSFFCFLYSHPIIEFSMEKETNMVLAFLDVCIDNNDPSCLKTTNYRKKTLT